MLALEKLWVGLGWEIQSWNWNCILATQNGLLKVVFNVLRTYGLLKRLPPDGLLTYTSTTRDTSLRGLVDPGRRYLVPFLFSKTFVKRSSSINTSRSNERLHSPLTSVFPTGEQTERHIFIPRTPSEGGILDFLVSRIIEFQILTFLCQICLSLDTKKIVIQ